MGRAGPEVQVDPSEKKTSKHISSQGIVNSKFLNKIQVIMKQTKSLSQHIKIMHFQ